LLGYLTKINQKKYSKHVWIGTIGALLTSIVISLLFQVFKLSFEGEGAELFEVIIAGIAIVVVTYMVIWMQKQSKNFKGQLQHKINSALSKNQIWGIALLAFVTVIREGIETALFLTAIEGEGILLGAIIGLVVAAAIAWLIFKTTVRLDIRKFFLITGWLLIFIAAGLVAHIAHALSEFGIIPSIIEQVWNLEDIISNESLLGKLLHAFVGYESTPSLIQVIFYSIYVALVGYMFTKNSKPAKTVRYHIKEFVLKVIV